MMMGNRRSIIWQNRRKEPYWTNYWPAVIPRTYSIKDGLVDELKKALSERILNTEIDEHLDGDSVEGKANHRNGYSKKSVPESATSTR